MILKKEMGESGWQFWVWPWSPILFYQLFEAYCRTNQFQSGLSRGFVDKFQNWLQKTDRQTHSGVHRVDPATKGLSCSKLRNIMLNFEALS